MEPYIPTLKECVLSMGMGIARIPIPKIPNYSLAIPIIQINFLLILPKINFILKKNIYSYLNEIITF